MGTQEGLYLSDLLTWLQQLDSDGVYAELLRRRPDLLRIGKDWAHSCREVPYLDIVNEILDEAASRGERYTKTDDPLSYWLIDTRIQPWQKTTRVIQACISVQFFVQRCLLNLEPSMQVSLPPNSGWYPWEWLESLSLWESNRGAFHAGT
jgi:hypothetical protein